MTPPALATDIQSPAQGDTNGTHVTESLQRTVSLGPLAASQDEITDEFLEDVRIVGAGPLIPPALIQQEIAPVG